MICLDRNASYGVLPEVQAELFRRIGHATNPSAIHSGGQRARALVEEARDQIADLLQLPRTAQIIFTSGATEANNMALMAPFWHPDKTESSLVTTTVEHPSILAVTERLSSLGVDVKELSPTAMGSFDQDQLLAACSTRTRIVSIMAANNETGHLFPVAGLAKAVKQNFPQVLFHTDGVQLFGKGQLSWAELHVDLLSLSGHKIGALPGVGALVKRKDVQLAPLLLGGPQELHHRAGTENLHGIVSFGIAASIVKSKLAENIVAMKRARCQLQQAICSSLPDIRINTPTDALPNTLNIRIPGVRADDLVVALDLAGIEISSGAACASGKPEPSHVLRSLGLSDAEARECIRISVGADHSETDLTKAAAIIVKTVRQMKQGEGADEYYDRK